jgi:exodeoxyribonuclease V beta subunit
MRADLEALAARAPGCIEVTDLSMKSSGRYMPTDEAAPSLHYRTATRELRRTWRTSSFSALASSGGTISQPAAEGLDHDAGAEIAAAEARPARPSDQSLVVLHDFPAGARAGQLIHEVLEEFDFQAADPGVLHATVAEALAHFGFENKWAEPLGRAMADVVATPLDNGTQPICLRDIPLRRRLNELEFLFPVAGQEAVDSQQSRMDGVGERARRDAVMLTRDRLATVYARYATAPVPADYAERVRGLAFTPLAGFLKGFIDLIFEHAGRWFLVDYKSNRLGVRADDYRRENLVDVMTRHHYFLQYHLYVVALHRYLTRRLLNYDYDRDFGGVYYLFLRGMAPAYAAGNGVFYDRPSRQFIEALSAALAGSPEDAR